MNEYAVLDEQFRFLKCIHIPYYYYNREQFIKRIMPQPESLRVFVRVRPPISKEIEKETAVHVSGNQSIVLTAEKTDISCSYDFVFNELSTQDQVFERIKPLLSDVLSGINGCIFAYGQTSGL